MTTTHHRPTASETTQIRDLTHAIRHLWSTNLRASGPERERLVLELTDARLALERLAIRSTANQFRRNDSRDLAILSDRIEQLGIDWQLSSDLVAS